ncbi:MAG: L-aspartate oxidase, partial [Bdellovibrionales bacterium]|nr:L-aspartate oxidase [Bdellovibrionales bacterium]
MPTKNFDFLVIGGGIAGLSFALDAAKHGSVAVLFKKSTGESSTAWAQGGIAAVSTGDDSADLHIQDTQRAGAGLCDPEAVKIVVEEGPERVRELIARGARFDQRIENGKSLGFDLHQEGGHSKRRIFHMADSTGYEIQRALLTASQQHSNIAFYSDCNAIDLITSAKLGVQDSINSVHGAYVLLNDGTISPFLAKKTLVATGGAGKVYLYTSNPDIATGDGIAMCFRAGVPVANMEFFQFHPTCLYHPQAKSFLITEALRGEGGILRRINGEAFMKRYHEDAELAPRDIVARAIDHEMKLHGEEFVLLDVTHLGQEKLKSHFPNIFERCLSFGIDISEQPIPVVPAAHYCCGGVVTNINGGTKLANLYVAGESAYSGLHGANRLASNSLLEALVFAKRAADHAIKHLGDSKTPTTVPDWDSGSATDSDEQV